MNHWMITQWRIFKTGAQNFVRNLTLAVAAMAVMVITLTIILFSVVANATFSNTVTQLTDRINVSVYLKDEVAEDDEQRVKFMEDIKQVENVERVEFVSKDDALEQFREDSSNSPELLTALSQTDNPLPASFRIWPENPNNMEPIREFLEEPNVADLQSDPTSYSGDRRAAIDRITEATEFIRQAGIVGIIIFMIVSVMIIFNTIRMAIFNRREELQIMRLLGASTWYIRGPFVVETVIYGVISAMISVLICNFLFVGAASAFEATSLGVLDINYAGDYFKKHYLIILTIQLAIGILIGAASSVIATRRYLKFRTSK